MKKLTKKIMIGITAATIALSAVPMASFACENTAIEQMNYTVEAWNNVPMYVSSVYGANVRREPSTGSEIIRALDYNTQITACGKTSNGWIKVMVPDSLTEGQVAGYIRADLVANRSSSKRDDLTPSWIKTGYNNNLSANTDTFRVRVAPGTILGLRPEPKFDDDHLIAQLQNGEIVQLVNQRGGNGDGTYWYVMVPRTGQSGFVNSNYLEAVN